MKVISYSLFGDPNSFEFGYYLRGLYFNARMNQILYPDFISWLTYDRSVDYQATLIIAGLANLFKNFVAFSFPSAPRCESMLWRTLPLFDSKSNYVLCRDLDSVSTYREACCVYEWLNSGLSYHGINDNVAHGGLMGGLVGFRRDDFIRDTGYTSFDHLIKGQDLKHHGSDQNFMNKYIHPKIKHGLMMHKLKGAGIEAKVVKTEVPKVKELNPKLWTTDLISRYIGSAGVIDFELLRWFRANDPNPEFDAFEKKYPNIFYWAK